MREKFPRLDGMMVEVLQACWTFISNDCEEMIKHFWSNKEFPHNFIFEVMKVIPKKPDKIHLRD